MRGQRRRTRRAASSASVKKKEDPPLPKLTKAASSMNQSGYICASPFGACLTITGAGAWHLDACMVNNGK
jgi:hypothetical protein